MNERWTGLILGIGAVCLAAFGLPSSARAAATYDPSNIMRDDVFANAGSMSQQDVQAFLVAHNSCLATVDPSELGGSGQTAAQIIATAATTYTVNPQVILVTLQKEQSLVGSSCAQLDASQGHTYALTHALGYDVPDVLGVGTCLYSFSAQLLGTTCSSDRYMGGPQSMRTNFNNNAVGPGGSSPFPAAFSVQKCSSQYTMSDSFLLQQCGSPSYGASISLTPQSRATAMLFRYTPYAYYGNYNFFTIFQSYFGNPAYGNGLTIVQVTGAAESSVLYNGSRYPILSMEALNAWGLGALPVSYISSGTYAAYPVSGFISRLVKEMEGPKVFVVQGGVARHISTSLYTHDFGLDNEPLATLPDGLIYAALREGDPVGFLVQASGQSAIYLSQATLKYYVPSVPVIEAWGFQMSELVQVSPSDLGMVPTAGNLSTLVKGSSPEIYVASLHHFVYAPSPSRLADWNMQSLGVTYLDDSYLQSLPKLGSLSRLTRGTGPDTYYIENKKRYYVSTLSSAASLESQYGTLTPMSDTAIASLPYSGVR